MPARSRSGRARLPGGNVVVVFLGSHAAWWEVLDARAVAYAAEPVNGWGDGDDEYDVAAFGRRCRRDIDLRQAGGGPSDVGVGAGAGRIDGGDAVVAGVADGETRMGVGAVGAAGVGDSVGPGIPIVRYLDPVTGYGGAAVVAGSIPR